MSRGGRSFCGIIRDPNSHEYARPKHLYDWSIYVWISKKYQQEMGPAYKEIQSYCKEDTVIFISHFRILSSFFARYLRCILIFTFWVLSDILLSRILGYKLGFVRSPKYRKYYPRRRGSGKSHRRGIRYKKKWHRKKHRIKKKRATRPPLVESSSSVFTTVLNVDKRVRTRDLLQYDTIII